MSNKNKYNKPVGIAIQDYDNLELLQRELQNQSQSIISKASIIAELLK